MLQRRDARRAARRPAALRRRRARGGAGRSGPRSPRDRLPRLSGCTLPPAGRATTGPLGGRPAARAVAGSRDGRGAGPRARRARRLDDPRPPPAGGGTTCGRRPRGGAAGERARLEAERAAAAARIDSLLRSIRRRDTEIDRLLGGAPERTLADLAAMPGFGVARLEPRSSGVARGHLLWHPARAAALLYAFALPPARRAYRIELELDDGRVQA